MIEITERFAVAQRAAAQVLKAMNLVEGVEPLDWIRLIDDFEKNGQTIAVRCTFWIKGNPADSLDLDVHLAMGVFTPHRPWTVIVRYPHSDRVDRWDFDNEGIEPKRIK